jgi:hypothetical protein
MKCLFLIELVLSVNCKVFFFILFFICFFFCFAISKFQFKSNSDEKIMKVTRKFLFFCLSFYELNLIDTMIMQKQFYSIMRAFFLTVYVFLNRSLALKHLSPNTSETETYNVASNFEAGLYQRCTSKVSFSFLAKKMRERETNQAL